MGAYTQNLRRRLAGRDTTSSVVGKGMFAHMLTAGITPANPARKRISELPVFEQVVPPHPGRYPKHQGTKGTVFNGFCNVTRCDNDQARWFNRGTKGYYCRTCADGINWNPRETPLCVQVDHDLTHEEMDVQEREMMNEIRVLRA